MQTAVLETHSTAVLPVGKRRSASLDPQVADRLLDMLSSDDGFRALFMRNPREALSQVGFVNETELASPDFCLEEFRSWRQKRLSPLREARSATC
jgi:hypothetical protein